MKKILQITFFFLFLGSSFWVATNQQLLVDSYVNNRFQPSQAVQDITGQIKLSDHGQFLFYATQPQLSDQASFNDNCHKKHEQSVVLGCYINPQNSFIYNVSDPSLNGVKQVTAAHEMLHAAYDRLSSKERTRINNLIEEALPGIEKSNSSLSKRLEIYAQTEPGERDNELHSIIGTESAELPVELEDHYAKYFQDRSRIVAFASQYTKVFTDLQKSQQGLVDELKLMAANIEERSNSYNSKVSQLNADIEGFNQRAQSTNGYSSQQEFDADKRWLNDRRSQIENEKNRIISMQSDYDAKRQQLVNLNIRVDKLNSKLDSTANPDI